MKKEICEVVHEESVASSVHFLRSDPILNLKPVNRIFHYITTGKLALLVACSISHLLNAYDNKRGHCFVVSHDQPSLTSSYRHKR